MFYTSICRVTRTSSVIKRSYSSSHHVITIAFPAPTAELYDKRIRYDILVRLDYSATK